jgi:hypothetical protein
MRRQQRWNPLLCSLPDSVKVNALSIGAETLYVRLLARSDDGGNYDGSSKRVLCGLYARRWEAGQVDDAMVAAWINEVVGVGLAVSYEVQGETYLHLVGAKKILKADRPRDYRFPTYEGAGPEDQAKAG